MILLSRRGGEVDRRLRLLVIVSEVDICVRDEDYKRRVCNEDIVKLLRATAKECTRCLHGQHGQFRLEEVIAEIEERWRERVVREGFESRSSDEPLEEGVGGPFIIYRKAASASSRTPPRRSPVPV